jgi:protein SCO1/2
MSRLYATAAAALLAAMLGISAGYVMLQRGDDRLAGCGGTNIASGNVTLGGPFSLIDKTGKTVTETDVITKPSLVYFGYTFCPDVCPLDSARNAEAVNLLAEQGIEAQPVFISVDPKRDTPQVVGDFAANFDDRLIGLTGTPEEIRKVADAYRIYYNVPESDDPYYMVDHTTQTYFVLPGEGVVDVFSHDTLPETVAGRAACIIERS